MRERRIQRLEAQIKETIAGIVQRELADPKLGLLTITRVELDKEFTVCRAYWSVLGGEQQQARTRAALQRARGFVQQQLGATLHTRTVPRLEFLFDASIAGAIRIQHMLDDLRMERERRAPEGAGPPAGEPPQTPDSPTPESPTRESPTPDSQTPDSHTPD